MLKLSIPTRLWLIQIALLALLSSAFSDWSLAIFALLMLAKIPQLTQSTVRWSLKFSNLIAALIAILLALFNRDAGLLNLMIHLLLLAAILRLLSYQKHDFLQLNWVHFFLIACCFIMHQSLWLTLVIVAVLLAQLRCHYLHFSAAQVRLPWRRFAKVCAVFVPVLLIFFLVFPRLPPLWQLPTSQVAQTGLGTELDPGSIEQLVESDELAFRVEFEQKVASAEQLYWRARQYNEFNGRSWRSTLSQPRANFSPPSSAADSLLRYRVFAEPHQQRHLFALGIPIDVSTNTFVNTAGFVRSVQVVSQRNTYQVHSVIEALPASPNENLKAYLQLPEGNPLTRQLAAQMRQQAPEISAFKQSWSDYLQTQGFSYTLTPSLLRGEQLDDFLFQHKAGFCSHYASVTAFVFRAAGIPSRIVAGYLGGEWRQDQSYLEVRQRDAHAWVEYYDQGRWHAYDPTLEVAPDRLTNQLEQLLSASERLRLQGHLFNRFAWSRAALNMLADLDYRWTRWIIGFDTAQQHDLFDEFKRKVAEFQWSLTWIVASIIFLILPLLPRLWRRIQQKRQQTIADWLIATLAPVLAKPMSTSVTGYLELLAGQYPALRAEIEKLSLTYQTIMFAGQKQRIPEFKKQTRHLVRQIHQAKPS